MAQVITTLRCAFRLDGVEDPDLGAALVELEVIAKENQPVRCTATFAAGPEGGDIRARQGLDFGHQLQVARGDLPLFSGAVVALGLRRPATGAPLLRVVAEDALGGLSRARRTRTFSDRSDADLVRQVAVDHGLQPEVELPGPALGQVAQVATTDLDFLADRLHRLDARMWVEDRVLHVRVPQIQPAAGLRVSMGQELREFTVLADVRGQHEALSAVAWDVSAKAGLRATATDGDLGPETLGGATGGGILSQAFGSASEVEAWPLAATGAEALAQAQASFRRGARRFVSGQGVAELDGRIAPGATLVIQGLGTSFSGAYLVTQVRHRFDPTHGYRTEFNAERPALGRA